MSIKIMIIEDDFNLRVQLSEVLKGYGYQVSFITDFKNTLDTVKKEKPDLVILDINLPYFDGYYYCKMIRKESNIPIIVTSARNSESDQILSMELGCDDYITKPFSIPIFVSKINALVRRIYGKYTQKESLEYNGLSLNENDLTLSFKNIKVELSKNEYKIMKLFIQNPEKLITRDILLEAIWDDKLFVDDNTLTVNMTRIKNKLVSLNLENAIKTKRGLGYILEVKEWKKY